MNSATEDKFEDFEIDDVIDRQRKLLDAVRRQEMELHGIELLQLVCKEEEVLSDQHLFKHEINSSLDDEEPGAPQMKEEQEELCISQEEEQLEVKQETDALMLTRTQHREEDTLYLNPDKTLSVPQKETAIINPVIISVVGAPNTDWQPSTDFDAPEIQDQQGDICEDDFKFKSNIAFKMVAGDRPYICPTCGKDFKTRNVLSVHMTVHRNERPYICQTCGKDFKTRTVFSVHMRIHTGERPYICRTCGKDFRQNYHLTGHMRVHTGEKPYICEICGKDYNRSHRLTVHMRRAHTGEKPHLCKLCGKRFTVSSALTVHMRIHSGEKPYVCKSCGKDFRRRHHLTAHARTVHINERRYLCTTEKKDCQPSY